jgi:glycosyltransferase involved in cell wall biosynthesis
LGAGSLMENLQKQAKKIHIEDRVFFVGNVERNEIWNYYKDADVFVLLSKAEALGIVFWEAMYVGVPTLGSDVEGIKESLGSNGERGRIWKEESGSEGFIKEVAFCTSRDTVTCQRMIEEGKKFVDTQIKNRQTINDYINTITPHF